MTGGLAITRDGPTVGVRGDLDYAHYAELETVLDALVAGLRPGGEVVVDLTGVAYCDSCGLRVLLAAAQRAEARGARLVLRGADGQPRRALRLTGLDSVLGPGDGVDGVGGVDGVDAVRA